MQVSKWGNSLAVRLPKKLVETMKLQPGDELTIVDASKHAVAVSKVDRRNAALERMRSRGWMPPADFKFDRDEANER
ncbi:MAG: AbrB/MazE/SpoVT family DNA-binding domain-containing protein [Proteobacteria bacterium]|nr:AbrB/MazE/SpoVT family DNA-binding domain-containing protein [Pseudomonadota bacterium]